MTNWGKSGQKPFNVGQNRFGKKMTDYHNVVFRCVSNSSTYPDDDVDDDDGHDDDDDDDDDGYDGHDGERYGNDDDDDYAGRRE